MWKIPSKLHSALCLLLVIAAPLADAKNALLPNETLYTNESITSANGAYTLIMQTDGNLVLYSGGTALWASNTAGHPGLRAVMQGDGNLVIYDSNNGVYWASNTCCNSKSFLIMQDDGNLVLYHWQPIFASNTQDGSSDDNSEILHPNTELNANSETSSSLQSGNSAYRLTMQTDGNLVLYRNSDNYVPWMTGTQGTGAVRAVMQGDGNFVVYNSSNQALWASNTAGNPGSMLHMQSDGNVVIYKPVARWASGGGAGPPVSETVSIGGSLVNARDFVTIQNYSTLIALVGTRSWSTTVQRGSFYHFTIAKQPPGQFCTISNGDGTANGNVTNIFVSCSP